MSFVSECITALDEEGLFDSSSHRTRFKELLDCYGSYPFFSKGLCKCIYLSAWDEEHFCVILEMLSIMSLGRDKNTEEMRDNGDTLVSEQTTDEYYVYLLSNAFLDDAPYCLPENAEIRESTRHIIFQALRAAEVIDSIC